MSLNKYAKGNFFFFFFTCGIVHNHINLFVCSILVYQHISTAEQFKSLYPLFKKTYNYTSQKVDSVCPDKQNQLFGVSPPGWLSMHQDTTTTQCKATKKVKKSKRQKLNNYTYSVLKQRMSFQWSQD